MFIDMHCHSVASDDARATVEGYLKWVQHLRGKGYTIDGIVLTEHRTFDLMVDYRELARRYQMLVLKGAELDTRCGHFLVYGVTPELAQSVDFGDVNLDPLRLIQAARATGGLAVPAHPGRAGIGLCEYIAKGRRFDGVYIVEVLNGGSRPEENAEAAALAQRMGYLAIGGSDAHFVSAIGSYMTWFADEIIDEGGLVRALLKGNFRPVALEETRSASNPSAKGMG